MSNDKDPEVYKNDQAPEYFQSIQQEDHCVKKSSNNTKRPLKLYKDAKTTIY